MALKETIDKIIGMVTGDNADAVKEQLRSLKTEANTVLESLSEANSESANRKKVIAEMKAEKETLATEIETLKKQTPDVEQLRAKASEYDKLLARQQKEKSEAWAKKAEIFAIPETDKRHPLVNKIKDRFHFPAEGQTLTEQQIDENMRIMSTLEAAGSFEVSNNNQPGFPTPKTTDGAKPTTSGKALFTNKLT